MDMWQSKWLHHLWCEAGPSYFVSEECACIVCGCAGVDRYHLLKCQWASCESFGIEVNRDIEKVLHTCNSPT